MKWAEYYDIKQIRQTIKYLKPNNELFEIRIIGKGNRKRIISGYFTNADTLIQQLDTIDPRGTNIYITINKVNVDCYAREQHDCFRITDSTTHDHEIDGYEWLFIDLDPKRIADVSSTDEELESARILSDKVYNYLSNLGFKEPVQAISGNGYHLLYRISLNNTDENKTLIERCLTNLAAMFDTDKVKIDIVNHNPSRICKLYGTLAQKGSNTKARPHRMSKITSLPTEISINGINVLMQLADELPQVSKPARNTPSYNMNIGNEFDIEMWMAEHGLEPIKKESGTDCIIYPLANCPFDHSHTNGDSKIFKYSNGAIAFKCHHNSCHGKTWQDVRELLEPGAYDAKTLSADDEMRIDAGYQHHLKVAKAQNLIQSGDKTERTRKLRKLKTAQALMDKDLPDPKVFIGVGEELPILVEGTCILSAKPKLGKSWLALAMCVAVAEGKDFLGYKTNQCATLYLDLETSEVLQQKRLRKVLGDAPVPDKFYLETETDPIGKGFVEQIEYYLKEDPTIGIVVIDVFQIVRSQAKSIKESEYEHAYRDITPLNELAQKHHIAIILVCHDRKAVDPDDPFSNILGSTGLQGAATQMMVMFRKRKDEPIHISIKGKTIDGLPELNVRLDNGEWVVVDGATDPEREQRARRNEFMSSNIRKVVKAIAEENRSWKGRCSAIIEDGVRLGIPVIEDAKTIGGFLCKNMGLFLEVDGVAIEKISNGTGGRMYRIYKSTVDTVDENSRFTVDEFRNPSNSELLEIPFL